LRNIESEKRAILDISVDPKPPGIIEIIYPI
jgi:hypothetical protein